MPTFDIGACDCCSTAALVCGCFTGDQPTNYGMTVAGRFNFDTACDGCWSSVERDALNCPPTTPTYPLAGTYAVAAGSAAPVTWTASVGDCGFIFQFQRSYGSGSHAITIVYSVTPTTYSLVVLGTWRNTCVGGDGGFTHRFDKARGEGLCCDATTFTAADLTSGNAVVDGLAITVTPVCSGGFMARAPEFAAATAADPAPCVHRSEESHTLKDGTGRLAYTCGRVGFERYGLAVLACRSCDAARRCGESCSGYVPARVGDNPA